MSDKSDKPLSEEISSLLTSPENDIGSQTLSILIRTVENDPSIHYMDTSVNTHSCNTPDTSVNPNTHHQQKILGQNKTANLRNI